MSSPEASGPQGPTDGSTPGEAAPEGEDRRRRSRQDEYRGREEGCKDREAEAAKRAGRVTWARVGLFVALVVLLFWSEWNPPSYQGVLRTLLLLALVVFIVMVAYHRRLRKREAWFRTLARLNREGVDRLERNWGALPLPPGLEPPEEHPYGRDLGISGNASLGKLLGTVASAPGRDALRKWLLEPPPPRAVASRQEGIRELTPLTDLREELTATGRLRGTLKANRYDDLRKWAEAPPWLLPRTFRKWVVHLLPLVTLPLVYLTLQEVLHRMEMGGAPPWFPPLPLTMTLVVGQALLAISMRTSLHGVFERASTGNPGLGEFADVFGIVEDAPFEGAVPRGWRDELLGGEVSAHGAFTRLRRLLDWSEARHSGLHDLLDILVFWDAHVCLGLERWKRRHGERVGPWFRALGNVDAAAALATLAWDHPSWSFPEVGTAGTMLVARDVGHPLLHPRRCVTNDVEVGPAGTFLLVTGSNMAGKSTLLRAVGLNVVLARAGGPVCASHLHLPHMRVHTTMGVSDSLAEGHSQFSAELRRLKQIEDGVKEADASGGGATLCLLDELLRGTNTLERRAGARRVIRSLLSHDTLLMVTTHDLELADAPDLAERSRPVHFDGTVEEGPGGELRLSFDYRLREGLATTTNAIALMDFMGLGLEGKKDRDGEP